jgi:acetyl esterase
MPLDPQCQALVDEMGGTEILDTSSITPEFLREGMKGMAAMTEPGPELAEVTDRTAPGPNGDVPVRVFRPRVDEPLPLLMFFHGGGFVLGDLDLHDAICRTVSEAADCVVVSVDYRLAPEHPYPAGVEDCFAATRWAVENAELVGVDRERVSVGGDSAGGNMAAVVALMARDRGGPKLSSQLLIYPVIDTDFDTDSYLANASGYLLTRPIMRWFWGHYLADPAHSADAYACPIRSSDLRGLPPAMVITAGYDPLRDEGAAYAAALEAAGVETVHRCYEGMIHGFYAMTALLDTARDAVGHSAGYLHGSWAAAATDDSAR